MSLWQEQQKLLKSNLDEVKGRPAESVNRHVRGVIERLEKTNHTSANASSGQAAQRQNRNR